MTNNITSLQIFSAKQTPQSFVLHSHMQVPLVMLTFEWPAASRTSAKVLPPAKAWLMKV